MQKLILSADQSPAGGLAVLLLVLRVLLALFFLMMAFKNLTGDAAMAADFQRFGYADWFRAAIGVCQAAGALALLIAPISFFGALLLGGILVGAAVSHALHDPPSTLASPLVFLALMGLLLWSYRPPLLR